MDDEKPILIEQSIDGYVVLTFVKLKYKSGDGYEN